MNFKAILVDCDGVLVDSERTMNQIIVQVFKESGINAKEKDMIKYIGSDDRACIDDFSKAHNKPLDFEKTNKRIHKLYYERDIPPVKGSVEFLNNLKAAGFKIALVSSAIKKKILKNLDSLKVKEDFFDVIISGDDIIRNKPYGDIYQYAALSLKVPYENCLVFEDSKLGVQAGINANCKVIGLSTSFSAKELEDAGAMFVFEDFTTFDDFKTIEEFNNFIKECTRDDRVQYGAVKCFEREFPLPKEVLVDVAIKMASKARNNAYTPYSNYKVGACVVSASSNNIYSGCNVENASFGGTICAERGAVMNLVSKEGATGIKMVVVVTNDDPPAPPCAICLQVLSEFCNKDTEIHLVDEQYAKDKTKGKHEVYKFKDFLPKPFIFN